MKLANIKNIKIGNLEFELPDHVITLDQSLINEISSNEEIGIVACGLYKDRSVILITSKGEIRNFNPDDHHIPPGIYVPTPGGQVVHLPGNENRWPGYSQGFFVKSKWLIENSSPEMNSATLQMNNRYVGDINITSLETVDT